MEHEPSQSVRVAVNIRPLVTPELLVGCTDCINVYPSEKQVQIGSHAFTFDNIFGSKTSPSSSIFDDCVAPLVDALFHGYNGTVLAYGQTGSGKTYTMGTNYNGEEHGSGVIPKVMNTIFSKAETMKESAEFLIRVSFIEIFKEEVFDLLDPKTTGPARVPIQIRERASGGITLAGVTEAEVRTKEEMASYLLQGSLCRATGSTNMNTQSSRSHAIFTISMEQRRLTHSSAGDDVGDDVLVAKLHLVDLAGSERAKRTGADGTRLQEGIHINKGLLALGNVISALGDDKKRKEGGHVPYRDSKLTRILQDSLGGNSKTVMIACISPADTNAEETLNTLKYANRARNIQNKAIINRDPAAAQLQRMRSQIEQLQAELLYLRGDSSAPAEEIKILKHKISLLEASKRELQEALQECRSSYEHLTQRAIDAQVERDRLIMQMESIQNGKPMSEMSTKSDKDFDMMKSYITKIQELDSELIRLRNSSRLRHDNSVDYLDSEDDGTHSGNSYLIDPDLKAIEADGMVEVVEKELEHSSLQEKLDRELKELDEKLEQKEAEMKRFASADTSNLKQHYEKKVQDLELEKRALQKEIEELRHNLANISSNSDDSAHKLKEAYLQKLNVLETQVADLKKKQDAQAQLLRQKQKSDEAAKRLHDEIHRIKTQKVQLQQKIKQESEQFRLWKASREKEVLQLKKEGRRNEYELHKLLALNQRQKLVLQRKTEEAANATKRLKELLDSRKASRETPGAGSNKGPGIQALVQSIEHELEVTVGVHEVRSEYERQMKERARMAEEVARLKEEAWIEKQQNLSKFPQAMSPGARNSRVLALENMLSTSSSALVSMASQLSEAEERERAFSGRGRWNQVRSLAEAKNLMNFLFNVASSSSCLPLNLPHRCQLRDKEFDCREKDSEIRELKEKVVTLGRQLELKKAELSRQENLMKLALERQSKEMKVGSETYVAINSDGHVYDLRPKGYRNSSVLNSGAYGFELLEDMDTSDDDQAEYSDPSNDDDTEWEHTKDRKKRQNRKRNSRTDSHVEIIDLEQPEVVVKPTEAVVCCSCSRSSACKTSRCECRAASGSCSLSCSCEPTRCSNRGEIITKDFSRPDSNETAAAVGNMLEAERNNIDLASHGAMLLQNALSEKPVCTNDGGTVRKPLSDIGNNLALSGVPKPTNPRKKWRKSTIQLVPATPAVAQSQNVEVPEQPKTTVETDNMPLKLPRAIRSPLTNNNQLPNEPVNDENCTSSSLGSPRQQARTKNGKENRGL
ncbi:chromosome-associated kinesin kif4 [Phtheirospermum japonicum]|uniref:Chromosome-associated kinesin kif4 n=1 Tax=Phtheirospermum japonicum TaxID=374723 RepID=A0A830C2E7_9LAMI|nr:chromosome-associated kinesin kif4 [Phtheirospermum japonicum]